MDHLMRESMDAMRNGDMTGEEIREEMKQYREEAGKELRKFLSEDEAKKVEESLRRRGEADRAAEAGGGEGGGARRRPVAVASQTPFRMRAADRPRVFCAEASSPLFVPTPRTP